MFNIYRKEFKMQCFLCQYNQITECEEIKYIHGEQGHDKKA